MTLLAGAFAVIVLYLLLQMFRAANPAVLARAIKIGGGVVSLAVAAYTGLRGELAVAVPLGIFGAGLLGWAPLGNQPFSAIGGLFGGLSGQRSGGKASRVRSRFFEMTLDHDSGALTSWIRASISIPGIFPPLIDQGQIYVDGGVINNMPVTDAKGRVTMQPVPADLLTKVDQLVKDAMGYDAQRGDSVNVVNSAFTKIDDPFANIPWWRTPDMLALYKQIATWLGIGAVALFLYFVMVKPALRRAFPPPPPPAEPGTAALAIGSAGEPILLDGVPAEGADKAATDDDGVKVNLLSFENEKHKFERNLDYARTIARQDPKIVATVVKNWVAE